MTYDFTYRHAHGYFFQMAMCAMYLQQINYDKLIEIKIKLSVIWSIKQIFT